MRQTCSNQPPGQAQGHCQHPQEPLLMTLGKKTFQNVFIGIGGVLRGRVGLEISLRQSSPTGACVHLGESSSPRGGGGEVGMLGGPNVSVNLQPCPDPDATVPQSSWDLQV